MIDKESVRNAALDEAVTICKKMAENLCLGYCCSMGHELAADAINDLKSQESTPSDADALEWLLTKVSGSNLCRAGVKEFSKEAVKEAMRQQEKS